MFMMIQNISNQNIFRPQTQSEGLKKIVSQINANVGKKQRLDTAELSKKALALLKENNEIKEKEPVLNYENSDMVSSERWGKHTKAEFAERSISQQRDDLKTLSDKIDYHKSKLEFTMKKISELENYLNGTGTHSDLDMTKERAELFLNNYKQSIVEDFSNFYIGRGQALADEFDKLSGGLSSKIFENPLRTLNSETLGLDNLPKDPEEIMKALEKASSILDKITTNLENAFAEATGGKTFAEPARSMSIFDGNSSHDFFESQMEGKFASNAISVEDFDLGGETIAIDKNTLVNL